MEINMQELIEAAIKRKQEKEGKEFSMIEATPEGERLTWKVTPEQVARINAGDREALDEFYLDPANNDRIRYCAYGFLRHNGYILSVASWEDLVQQVYCDLRTGFIKLRPYDRAIGKAIYRSFQFAPVGGLDEVFIPLEKGESRICQSLANCGR